MSESAMFLFSLIALFSVCFSIILLGDLIGGDFRRNILTAFWCAFYGLFGVSLFYLTATGK
jgi:hypothetical protein